jgi:hypothetical protein
LVSEGFSGSLFLEASVGTSLAGGLGSAVDFGISMIDGAY